MSTGKTGKVVDGWFTENDDLWPGQAMSYKIDEVLYEGKSKFQDILVLKTYDCPKSSSLALSAAQSSVALC